MNNEDKILQLLINLTDKVDRHEKRIDKMAL